MSGASPIKVAVGVVRNEQRQILIARRPNDKPHGGCWEFPGGKIHSDETVEQALCRELQEELNLVPLGSRRLINIHYDYDEYPVELDVRLVYQWRGQVHGREGQAVEWVEMDRLCEYTYPAANTGILSALRLPEICFITPESEINRPDFLNNCEAILAAGCRMIQFRCKNRPFSSIQTLFTDLSVMCEQYHAWLVLNGTPDQAISAGAGGCHLSSDNLADYRPASVPENFIVGASCHTRSELLRATQLQLDYVVLGPVQPTTSHPGAGCLDWDGFSELAVKTNIPVYAIGGMQMEDLAAAWEHGAHGLAAISGLWKRVIVEKRKLPVGPEMISA